jgi:hypothetical protein
MSNEGGTEGAGQGPGRNEAPTCYPSAAPCPHVQYTLRSFLSGQRAEKRPTRAVGSLQRQWLLCVYGTHRTQASQSEGEVFTGAAGRGWTRRNRQKTGDAALCWADGCRQRCGGALLYGRSRPLESIYSSVWLEKTVSLLVSRPFETSGSGY